MAQKLKNLPVMQETQVRSLDWDDPLGKEMATHSSTLVWKITWMKEPGIARVGHDWPTELNWTEFALIHGPNILGSYALLFFTASDLASITSHIHNWVLFLLWLRPFILSGVISPLISSSILGTYPPGEFIYTVLSFCLFIPFMGFSRQ